MAEGGSVYVCKRVFTADSYDLMLISALLVPSAPFCHVYACKHRCLSQYKERVT